MAKDFISIDGSAKFGGELKSCINSIQQGLNGLRKLHDVMLHNIDGSDYSWVATQFGLTRTGDANSSVTAQATYNLLAGAKSAIDSQAVNDFIEQVG